MGLDMYLTKETYIGANYDHNNVKGSIKVEIEGVNVPIKFKRLSSVREEVAYWRKANQIHNWFVKNVQGGIDECQTSRVSVEQLDELLLTVKEVLKHPSKAQILLPTGEGFFFGSTDYDEYYISDLKYTKKVLSDVLSDDNRYSNFTYCASW